MDRSASKLISVNIGLTHQGNIASKFGHGTEGLLNEGDKRSWIRTLILHGHDLVEQDLSGVNPGGLRKTRREQDNPARKRAMTHPYDRIQPASGTDTWAPSSVAPSSGHKISQHCSCSIQLASPRSFTSTVRCKGCMQSDSSSTNDRVNNQHATCTF